MSLFALEFKPKGIDYPVKNEIPTDDVLIMHEYIKAWCIMNKFLIPNPQNPSIYVANLKDKGFYQTFFSFNFKSLRQKASLTKFLEIMTDNKDSRTTSRLYDLFIMLSTRVNGRSLFIYEARYFHALERIEKSELDEYTWDEVREQFPLLWLIDYIQSTMRIGST